MIETPFRLGKGALGILSRLSVGDARFRDLNALVTNTRTLARRLRELESSGLIEKAGGAYRVTEAGFDVLWRARDVDLGPESSPMKRGGFGGLERWLRIPFKRLAKLLIEEFGDELVSIALYGSSVKGAFKMGGSDVDVLYVVEDGAGEVWRRESEVFKCFASTHEYSAFDHWFRMKGFHGYPEITTTCLRKNNALSFQPIYLDMLFHRAILYDKDQFLEGLMARLRDRLEVLGAVMVRRPDGSWYWVLKPDLKPGEPLEIDLR